MKDLGIEILENLMYGYFNYFSACDFTLGDSFMVGDVEFIWKEFYCPICKKRIPIDEMRRIEKEQRER